MRRNLAVLALLALVMTPATAWAQGQSGAEAALLQRANQFPREVSSLLELAKLYFDQQRYDDALSTLARAQAVIKQEQLVAVKPQSTSSRSMITSTGSAAATSIAPVTLDDWQRAAHVGANVQEPTRIKYVEPIYPAVAKAAKITGYVIIDVLIGADGRVLATNVIKPHPLLQEAALEAVRQWTYAPPIVNGAPSSLVMSVTVTFNLK